MKYFANKTSASQLASICLVTVVGWATCAYAEVEESIIYDPETGNYRLSYWYDDFDTTDRQFGTITLEPATKIEPSISSAFKSQANNTITYQYSVALGPDSRQPLDMFVFDPIQRALDMTEPPPNLGNVTESEIRRYQEDSVAGAPAGWAAFNFSLPSGHSRVGWERVEAALETFVAGSRQDGFQFGSDYLPAVAIVKFYGVNRMWSFLGEGPDPDSDVDKALETLRRNDHVPRFAAAPSIKVADPFDAVEVLQQLKQHVAELQGWALFDAALANEVSGYLAEAIVASQSEQKLAAVVPLKRIKVALRLKHPQLDVEGVLQALPPTPIPLNPVDAIRDLVTPYDQRLAARVVDFDVSYVLRRLSGLNIPPLPGQ